MLDILKIDGDTRTERLENGRERRLFIEERLSAAGRELRDTEEGLRLFLEQNRHLRDSPELQFRYERLQRQVRIKEQVFTALRQHYEEARIQEVNDTPLITVIDDAVPPDETSSPKLWLTVVLTFIVGAIVAFAREYVERAMEKTRRRSGNSGPAGRP